MQVQGDDWFGGCEGEKERLSSGEDKEKGRVRVSKEEEARVRNCSLVPYQI